MPDHYRAVARRSVVEVGFPRVGREVVGVYATRTQAETACSEYIQSLGKGYRAAYDDCIVELIVDSNDENRDG